MSSGFTKGIPVDTDSTLSANRDDIVPSQKAVKTYSQPKANGLTEISGLTPSNDDLLQRKAGAWVNRTLAQLWTDLKDLTVTLTNKTIALGSNTVSGTKAEFNTACTDGNFAYVGDFLDRKYFAYQNTDSSSTGITSVVVLANILIPAGTMGANGKMRFEATVKKTGTAGGSTWRTYVSTVGTNTIGNTGTPTNSTLIGSRNGAAATQSIGIFSRQLVNKNSESLQNVFPATADAGIENASQGVVMTAVNINTANDYWVVVTGQAASGADIIAIDNIQIYIEKP
jgi:hypothetical protein